MHRVIRQLRDTLEQRKSALLPGVYEFRLKSDAQYNMQLTVGDSRHAVVVAADEETLALVNQDPERIPELWRHGRFTVDGELSLATSVFYALVGRAEAAATRQPTARRRSESLAASQGRIEAVLRTRQAPSASRFRDEFVARGTPLIIERGCSHWEILKHDFMSLAERASEQRVVVRNERLFHLDPQTSEQSPSYLGGHGKTSMRLDEYVPQLLSASQQDPDRARSYARNVDINDGPIQGLIDTPSMLDSAFDLCKAMWLGPHNTVSYLHRDFNDNLFCQVFGQKNFALISPDQWENLYSYTFGPDWTDDSPVDPEQPDLLRYPKFQHAHVLWETLEPGDILFIPEGWWHWVRSVDPCLSINFWLTNSYRR